MTNKKMTRESAEGKRALAHALLDQVLDVVLAPVEQPAPTEVSSVRLPVDAKNADAFNRACRAGRDRFGNVVDPALVRVQNARKIGRIWICSREAWDARSPATPNLPSSAKAQARAKKLPRAETRAAAAPAVNEELLAQYGITRKRTGS